INLSYSNFRNCVNHVSNKFKGVIDKVNVNDKGFCSVGFLSNSDQHYLINLFALMQLNLTPLALSPRNSVPILVHLLKEAKCDYLFYDEHLKHDAEQCLKEYPELKILPLIKLSDYATINYESVEPLIKLNEDQVKDHIVQIIHSSGSTAAPKLNYLSNTYFNRIIVNERKVQDVTNFFGLGLICAPFFHIYGLSLIVRAFFNTSSIGLPRSNQNPTMVLEDIQTYNATYLIMLPYLLKQMKEHCDDDNKAWSVLSKLNVIQSGGAPIPKEVGDEYVNHNIKVQSSYGATEIGCIAYSSIESLTKDYNVLIFNNHVNYSIVNRDEIENTCEIVIDKNESILSSWVIKDPNDTVYNIGDVYKIIEYNEEKHELKAEVIGRCNDTIIHLTGEKTNPVPIEQTIMDCPYVDKCLVYGRGKLNNCCLISLNYDNIKKIPLLKVHNSIFEQIEKANQDCPSHSRVLTDLVAILPLEMDKGFEVTAKGNVIRKKSEVVFKEEIEQVYRQFESEDAGINQDEGIELKESDSLINLIPSIFQSITNKHIDVDDKFFDNGLDSLSAVKFRNTLIKKGYKVRVNDLYEHDTANKLTNYLLDSRDDKSDTKNSDVQPLSYYQKLVDDLLEEYKVDTTLPTNKRSIAQNDSKYVLVTGANGSLGSFIVNSLVQRDDVAKVYAMVRAKTSEQSTKRIQDSFRDKKIELTQQQYDKIEALPYNNEDVNLGLNTEQFEQIQQNVNVVYHVAWKMDFLKGVLDFKDCIQSTVNLLRLCAISSKKAAFNFTSTVGATFPVIETVDIDEKPLGTKLKNASACNGYNLSKLLSEQICFNWSGYYDFDLDIYRVGQISGDISNGVWNTKEHMPLMIKGSQVMKMIPEKVSEGVSWIPVDYAANGMVEIYFNPKNSHKNTISHIVNPKVFPWDQVIEALAKSGIKFSVVENTHFINELKNNPTYMDVDVNPLASLTDFFQEVLTNETHSFHMLTENTVKLSESIKTCPAVDHVLLSKYIQHW
ncbi:acetyl-CoA synthetase-like protein, partial [Neoconidiobolus thromboides FSU 785]